MRYAREFENRRHLREQVCGGFSILELLLATLILSIVLMAVVGALARTTKEAFDNEIAAAANDQARTLLDFMAYDLRMAGAGIPFYQSGFAIGTMGLGDAPLPLLMQSTASQIHLRLNERGIETMLSTDYTPSAGNLTFSVVSPADIDLGDFIYISDMTSGGASGMRAQVTNVSGSRIQIAPDYAATPAVQFKSGALVCRVSTVVYNSPNDWSGISRTAGGQTAVLAPDSRFSAVYLDQTGAAIGQLTETAVKTNLASIRLTINVRGSRALSNGATYTAEAVQEVALRNLILSR